MLSLMAVSFYGQAQFLLMLLPYTLPSKRNATLGSGAPTTPV